ncbi:hypothetical protein LH991_11105 [Schleiferilactobacillus harbinensis]|uniref:Uncharacterized protein n=1 Tax=Schleiferilactobacillus harbinensis DSM 16991 TaxID=1122147 RepID=A0A0R1XAP8_9LACO|nr:hypothetical protein [Schleiferilactobacillus harbinensis]KRM27271.1 hypothetical protein FC91_GL002709 [Schleiferilactobacillus harbinensis DSM 16991]MCT2908926.1 hypothetical protein [Schleiferilactobacillus harbinensis]QFR64486.1 hypothetical protein LH991_11105 [Schleiferilactobacillus harbinensis]
MNQSNLWNSGLIPFLKQSYEKRLDFFNVDQHDASRFIWAGDKHVQIFAIHVSYKESNSAYIVFARPSEESDTIVYKDARNSTLNYEFEQLVRDSERLAYVINKNVIPQRIADTIEPASLEMHFVSSRDAISHEWISRWVSNEYNQSRDLLEQRNQITPFPLSNQKIFVERLQFDKMVAAINNDQFTDEFNQCLIAYNDGYWFLCSVGLGTCIEHLLLLTLQNCHSETELQKQLGWDPTGTKYTSLMMKPPIKMSIRQAKYIRLLFAARNSVDHHNTGYTSKNLCDILLDGVANIFNDYFQPSMTDSKAQK